MNAFDRLGFLPCCCNGTGCGIVHKTAVFRPFEGKFLVYAEAAIKLLGISVHTRLEISTSGLSFSVTGDLWNVFEVCCPFPHVAELLK